MSAKVSAQGDITMTDEEKAAAEKTAADKKAADQKAANDKAAADKAEADRKAREAETSNAEHRPPNAEGVEKAMKDLTGERDTLKGQVTSITAERDAAVKERDAFKAEVDRLSKLVGKTSTPPAGGGGGKGKQTAEEWLSTPRDWGPPQSQVQQGLWTCRVHAARVAARQRVRPPRRTYLPVGPSRPYPIKKEPDIARFFLTAYSLTV